MPEPIRVLVADEYDLPRKGLTAFIDTCRDMMLVGEAKTRAEAIAYCDSRQPDVVLIDLMPADGDIAGHAHAVGDGSDDDRSASTIDAIHKQHPNIHLVVLTNVIDEQQVQNALRAGATSYLSKTITTDALAEAIRDANAGKATLAQEAAQTLVQATQRPAFKLTKREQEVLCLMAKGMNNTQIAKQLVVGVSTIKKHVSSILRKLDTTSRTEAVALAVRHNLVTE